MPHVDLGERTVLTYRPVHTGLSAMPVIPWLVQRVILVQARGRDVQMAARPEDELPGKYGQIPNPMEINPALESIHPIKGPWFLIIQKQDKCKRHFLAGHRSRLLCAVTWVSKSFRNYWQDIRGSTRTTRVDFHQKVLKHAIREKRSRN